MLQKFKVYVMHVYYSSNMNQMQLFYAAKRKFYKSFTISANMFKLVPRVIR